MLTTRKHDQRTRRQALFILESLDDRLVLSAGAGGAAAAEAAGAIGSHAALVEQRHEARIARHEAKLERIHARHEARLERMAARHAAMMPMAGPVMPTIVGPAASTSSAPTAAPAASTTMTPAATPSTPGSSGNINPIVPTTTPTPSPAPQSSPGPLPANVAAALQSLYTEFENAGGDTFVPNQPIDQALQISGNSVEVSLKIGPGTDFNTALSQLQADGMQVSSSSATYALIDGMLPISELPAAAQIASSVNPVPKPILN